MTKLFVLLTVCVAAICALPSKRGTDPLLNWRVVGGADASPGQFPYMVSLRNENRGHFCGGSILNEYWIVTAAHCVESDHIEGRFVVVGGNLLSSGGERYELSKIIGHEKWDENYDLENDIALIKLASPIQFNDKVQPIPLETEEVGVGVGADAVLTGWGDLEYGGPKPDILQFVQLKTVSNQDCSDAHELPPVFDTHVCALTRVGEGACHGDSGGPLASNGKLIGVVSWGYPCAKGRPDVFTRVSKYASWIKSKTDGV